MEDALAPHEGRRYDLYSIGLNPCFNGRCTRTCKDNFLVECQETSLNPCFNGRCTRTQ